MVWSLPETPTIGRLIAAGENTGPALFRVADMHRLRLYVSVPQTYAAVMKPGLKADLLFPDRPGKTYVATLDSTSSAIECVHAHLARTARHR